MIGLDPSVIDSLDSSLALQRIQFDVVSDFIIAPHYSAVFSIKGQELWENVAAELRSGKFEPSLAITIDVPKRNGLTRPGSILSPKDRLIYQLTVDCIAPVAEMELDRSSVFSNVLLDPPEAQMFEPSGSNWYRMQDTIRSHCEDDRFNYAIKADIACFFERLYQHNLINLLHACGCNSSAVNLLEKLLSAWTEKDSHGILQGVFPSDFLGNFYLYGLDSDLAIREIPFVRYVDDIYAFFQDRDEARVGLMNLCRSLRHEGLHLNDKKSRILAAQDLVIEETLIDALFQQARDEAMFDESAWDWYTLQQLWEEPEIEDDIEIEIQATEHLYRQIGDVDEITAERIEKFCLPLLAHARSELGVQRTIDGMQERPHLSKLYATYLAKVADYDVVVPELVRLLSKSPYDWQIMWVIALLIQFDRIPDSIIVGTIFRLLRDQSRAIALRGLCAIAIGKHGSAGQRRNLKHHYGEEPSEYVRSAIVFATRYFPARERQTCLAAWTGHGATNGLIADAVRHLVHNEHGS